VIIITRKLSHGQILFIEWTNLDLKSWWRWSDSFRRAERFDSTKTLRFRDAFSFALRDGEAFPVDEKVIEEKLNG